MPKLELLQERRRGKELPAAAPAFRLPRDLFPAIVIFLRAHWSHLNGTNGVRKGLVCLISQAPGGGVKLFPGRCKPCAEAPDARAPEVDTKDAGFSGRMRSHKRV